MADSKLFNRNRLKQVASIGIAFLGIYYVLNGLNLSETLAALRSANFTYVASGFLVLAFVYYVMGERWRQVLAEKNVKISRAASFKQLLISDFVNTFAPARAGDIYRGYLASDDSRDSLETSLLVLLERVLDVLAISVLLIFGLASFYPSQQIFIYPLLLLGLTTSGLIGIKIVHSIEYLPLSRLNSVYTRFRTALIDNFKSERWIELFAITIVIWLLGVGRSYFAFVALDIPVSIGLVFVVTFAWAMVAALPLTPSGLGTTDALIFVILGEFGVASASAGAFIVLNRLMLQGLPLALGGLFYLRNQNCQ